MLKNVEGSGTTLILALKLRKKALAGYIKGSAEEIFFRILRRPRHECRTIDSRGPERKPSRSEIRINGNHALSTS
ncbi:hypothetical protein MSHOH_2136 [Methanosarcina horonobensis HB-1 = JCM 15518]|uniref:Uncharacterized protein n=1 Tax=Methanosarcina horonobensis HB-1 = JCM 15518 TaxID=1434110 RepID=A0A0E3SAA5_9EURY|nr:hypothetical protein [Methanosarcina horonobensis]AKB78619.1 hypothetical protein MSHOH_2136 [Methanosarcina horonobensis HB-1 = JCM 15518]